jgi:peptide/nickel transport system permease protein
MQGQRAEGQHIAGQRVASSSSAGVRIDRTPAEATSTARKQVNLPKSRQFWIGLGIVSTAVAVALFAPLIAPHDPLDQNIALRHTGPTLAHPLGLDELGRDILSRVVWGARISLSTAVTAVAIALPVGTMLGAVSGYFRGITDTVVMRGIDVLLAYPGILLALVLIVTLGPSQRSVIIALAIGYSPYFSRIVRGVVMSEATRDYVLAARALGRHEPMILLRHVGPNVLGLLVVHASFAISGAMVTEASLSFLGLGVSPSTPSWGRMLSNGTQIIYIAPHVALFPIAVLSAVVAGWFLVGEGLREWLDPRRG